ncbi:MAG: hypothetical protein EXR71_03245 [Myxococcales bacterium]|nr:hypothetical protein [Myxococcales bacterium]
MRLLVATILMVAWSPGTGHACEPVAEVPEALQVAWVSKVPATAANQTWLQVVQLGDLRALVTRSARDSGTALRALGLLGRVQKPRAAYKVTVFEVSRSTLCRPMLGVPGTVVAGVPICDTPEQRAGAGVRTGSYSSCGYGTDLGAGVRGLDVFRVRWADAVTKGFCVLPWERMLAEG